MATDTIVRVDPKTLLVGPNVRKEITLPAEFVASIKEHGVKIPIVAHETPDGLEVVDGQMRTLAAIVTDQADVPVFVRAAATGAERAVDQMVINRERIGLSRRDTVAAVRELTLDFKMPAAQIVKKLGITKKSVDQATAIAGNDVAAAALDDDEVTLELAAEIAAADLTPAEAKAVITHRWNRQDALRSVIAERTRNAEVARLTEKATADGLTLVERPTHGEYSPVKPNKYRYLVDLVDVATGKTISTEAHASCKGHAAHIGGTGYQGSGKPEIRIVCTDPAKHGHRDRNKEAKKPLTEAAKAQKALENAAAREWPGVTETRTTWLRENLFNRATMPTTATEFFVDDILEQHDRSWSVYDFGRLARTFLGMSASSDERVTEQLAAESRKSPARAAAVHLATVIARHESMLTTKNGWSKVSSLYLSLLASWGYTLTEVEAGIAGKTSAKK